MRARWFTTGFLVIAVPWPAAAQDAIELRSVDGAGVEQPRLSVTSGTAAEVRLFVTFNAQSNPLVGLGAVDWSGIADPGISPPGSARLYFDSAANRLRMSENAGAWVDVGTVRSVGAGSGLTGGPITSSGTLSVATGGIDSAHLADGVQFVSVRNGADTEQFSVEDGNRALQIVGSGATAVGFDPENRRVTIFSTDANTTYAAGNQLALTGTTFDVVEGSGSGLDADLLDGLDSTAFMAAGTDSWVNTAGDTMSGSLYLQNQNELRLNELSVNGMHTLGHRAAASMPADVTLTWPATAGSNGQFLQTDGAGGLSWATPTAPSPDKLQRSFVVAADHSVAAGDIVAAVPGTSTIRRGFADLSGASFDTGNVTGYPARLDLNTFVVAYAKYIGPDNDGYAVVGTVSGDTLSFGAPSLFSLDVANGNLSVCAVSATKFVVSWKGSTAYYARVGVVTGLSISWGVQTTFFTDGYPTQLMSFTTCAWNGSGEFVLALTYYNYFSPPGISYYYSWARIGTVGADNSISWGGNSILDPEDDGSSDGTFSDYLNSADALSATTFVVIYGESSTFKARHGTIAGGSISFGPEATTNDTYGNNNYCTGVRALTSASFLVPIGYYSGPSGSGWIRVGTVSGNSLTFSAQYTYSAGSPYNATLGGPIVVLSPTEFVVSMWGSNQSAGLYGRFLARGTVSGSTITYDTLRAPTGASTAARSAVPLGASGFAFEDSAASSRFLYGKLPLATSYIGVAAAAGAGGASIPVILDGISDVHTGLSLGITYYADTLGLVVPSSTSWRVGTAMSATEIRLNPTW